MFCKFSLNLVSSWLLTPIAFFLFSHFFFFRLDFSALIFCTDMILDMDMCP